MQDVEGKDMRIFYAEAVYGKEETDAVMDVLLNSSKMLMDSDKVQAFEKKVCEIFGKKYGLMVNSGSSANLLGVSILSLPKGSEIITPALTFSTTVAPLIQNDLTPSFVDVEPGTYNIDANQVEEMITPKTKLMMIPNLIGNLPDWKKLKSIAKEHDLILLEDSADTLGHKYEGESTGKISDISTTSFYGSHVITCAGFGGMLCFNDYELYKKAKLLRGWGRGSVLTTDSERVEERFNDLLDGEIYDRKFIFEAIGYNFLPSELSAAFGLVQLARLEGFIEKRIENFNFLLNFFKQYEDWFTLPVQNKNAKNAWLAFPLTVRSGAPFNRLDLQIYFERYNVQTRTIFSGNILRQPGFKDIPHKKNPNGFPNSDDIMKGGILIGCHHGMNNDQLDYVCDIFRDFVKKEL